MKQILEDDLIEGYRSMRDLGPIEHDSAGYIQHPFGSNQVDESSSELSKVQSKLQTMPAIMAR